MKKASGKFVLRIDPILHDRLKREAVKSHMSLNEYCGDLLRISSPIHHKDHPLKNVIEQAKQLYGDKLIALALFGSFARGESTRQSDIDLLIVLSQSIRRELYHTWDNHNLDWQGQIIEPQIVNFPSPETPFGSIWGEVAIDGIILFDRELQLAKFLAKVRRDIIAGRIVRKVVQGQCYWVHNEVA